MGQFLTNLGVDGLSNCAPCIFLLRLAGLEFSQQPPHEREGKTEGHVTLFSVCGVATMCFISVAWDRHINDEEDDGGVHHTVERGLLRPTPLTYTSPVAG